MAKYNDVTAGQTEACINRMGGWDNFLRFIGGQGEIVFKTILSLITTIKLPAQPSFTTNESFKVDTSKPASPKIAYIDDNFKKWFGNRAEESVEAVELNISKLCENSRDDRILAEFGGKAVTTLSQLFALIKEQGNGEAGSLLVNGYANIFYIIDKDGEHRAVDAFWFADFGGWGVDASEVDYPSTWYAGDQVVSRK